MRYLLLLFFAVSCSAQVASTRRNKFMNSRDTVFLMHADGADASTTFTDSSTSAHTATTVADAQIDTAQSVFGGASGLFDGTGDRVTFGNDGGSDFNFGTGDYTIQARARWTGTSIGVLSGLDSGRYHYWLLFTAGTLYHQINNGGGDRCDYRVTFTPSLDQWYDFCIVRHGSACKIFIDGVSQSVTTITAYNGNVDLGTDLIGVGGAAAQDFDGHIDEVRVIKGRAAHTANFHPDASQYW